MPPRHHEGERSPYPGAVRSSRSAIDDQRRHFEDTPLCGYLTSAAAGALPASCRHAVRRILAPGPALSQSLPRPSVYLCRSGELPACLPHSIVLYTLGRYRLSGLPCQVSKLRRVSPLHVAGRRTGIGSLLT